MTRVGIFLAGYSECNVDAVVRILSRAESDFTFKAAGRIQTMGDPDIYGIGYSDDAVVGLIDQYRDQFDVCAILTAAPIEDNFFTRTLALNTIITTSYQADELLEKSGRSLPEYYALAICAELVSFASRGLLVFRGLNCTIKKLGGASLTSPAISRTRSLS